MEYGLRDYGKATETVFGGSPSCEHEWGEEITRRTNASGGLGKQDTVRGSHYIDYHNRVTKSDFCVKCGATKGQLGLEPSWQMYVEHMVEVCRELKRVLKRTGSMYIVLGDTYAGSHCGRGDKTPFQNYRQIKVVGNLYDKPSPQANIADYQAKCLMGVPWSVTFALIEDGWILRNDIIWHKPNSMPSSVKDRLSQTYEHIFHFVKNRKYYYDLDAIREPYKEGVVRWGGNIMKLPNNPKEQQGLSKALLSKTRPWRNPKGKNPGDVIGRYENPFKFNLRVRDVKRGKKGLYVEGGEVKELKASEEEVESYVYPEKPLTKHDVAVRRFPTVNRQGGLGYTDPLHTKAYNPLGKNPGDFWSITTKPFKGQHFAVYPEAICVKPILSSSPPNGIVLDPMCGSGTTCAVAKKLGRNYIGVEINVEYVEMARKRLASIPERLEKLI